MSSLRLAAYKRRVDKDCCQMTDKKTFSKTGLFYKETYKCQFKSFV